MSNSNDQPTNETQNKRANGESIGQPEVSDENRQYLPTLPRKFKSLVGTSIKIESEKPQDIIELLGNVLEVTDYKTNMAAYWFLDTIALHVLRYQKDLDEYYLGVLISWLTGEMTFIRDSKHPREKFVEAMEEIFNMAANKVSEENRLPYWDEIVHDIDAETSDEGEEFSEEEEQNRFKLGESTKKYKQEKQELAKINKNGNLSETAENVPSSVSKENVDALNALFIVIESTYNMYVNKLRYYLVHAVFVEPIKIKTYDTQFALRTPRPVKLATPGTIPFKLGLRSNLEMKTKAGATKRGKKVAGKKKTKLGPSGVPATPPPSLDDEEILAYKRQFILPLIEASGASEMFEQHPDET